MFVFVLSLRHNERVVRAPVLQKFPSFLRQRRRTMNAQNNLDKNIIDEKLLENSAEATQSLQTEDASVLKDNEDKEKSLEKEIKQALELLKCKKLSPVEYKELYEKAFSTAESLLKANVELAKKFKNLPTADGFRSDKYKLKGNETEAKTKTRILEIEYGIEYHRAWEIQQIDEELVRETIEEAKKKGKLPTLDLAIRLFRKKRSAENEAKKLEEKRKSFAAVHSTDAISSDVKRYNVIYANPIYESECSDKSLAWSIDDMKKLKIPSEDDAILFLWTNSTDLVASLEIVTAWGFSYREHAVWDFAKAKSSGLCFKSRHKILLVATKGENYPEVKLQKESVYLSRSEATEVKPTYYYETIERMFPEESYLDVFSAKQCNSKWKTLFNQDEEEKDNEEN